MVELTRSKTEAGIRHALLPDSCSGFGLFANHQRSTFYLVRFRASSRFRDTRSFAPGRSSDLLDVTESGP